ncbi:DDE superfamily endonuclease [Rhizobium sp. PP-F2F-G20b]|nr:DDE superfamily endonuclease [Rhizobium sp. PP-F2F-G20b]
MPESWTSDTQRMAKAGVPDAMRTSRTKPEIALNEIDRLIAAGTRFGTVLAGAGYGLSAAFRQELSARECREFRVRACIMGTKEITHGTTERACYFG